MKTNEEDRMHFPGKTKRNRMEFELGYWEQGGVNEHDLHLETYTQAFPFDQLDYCEELVLDVGSGPISVFEGVAPEGASIMPFDILVDEYNRLVPEKRFMINKKVSKGSSFSLITVFNMLDHVDDPEDILSYLQPLLHQGGRIWFAVHLYRPHGITGHPQKFSCRSIVSLVSKYFSIESSLIIREGIPVPYMWCGVLRPKEKRGRLPTGVVFSNYLQYSWMLLKRIVVKGLKIVGLRTCLPQPWRF